MAYYRDDSYTETDTYTRDDYRSGAGNYDDRITDTRTDTYTSDDSYGRRNYDGDDRYTTTTTTTTTYDDDSYDNNIPPPPRDLPSPWYAEWLPSERRYIFINDRTSGRRYEFPSYSNDNDYTETTTTTTTYYDDDGVRRYDDRGGSERIYENDERYRRYDDDGNLIDDVAGWAGRKVGEVERIPGDIAYGAGRVVEDVVDAPENMANWVGRKVGDVERFGDNVDYAYDEGKYDGRRY